MKRDLNELLVFSRVVEEGSFTAGARYLGLPTSTASRRIARLEERLGVRLLNRTTRKLSLTDAGRIYYERGTRVIADFEDMERVVSELQTTPRGTLRVTAPGDLGGQLWTLFDGFLADFPDIRLDLHFTERFVDLVEEGFDVAMRGGPRPDTATFVARELARAERILAASPDYLRQRGVPETPQQLRDHDCIVVPMRAPHSTWALRGARRIARVPIRGRVVTNDIAMATLAAIGGYGIAQLIRGGCADAIAAGRLQEVLPASCPTAGSLWLIYHTRPHLLPTVRAFVDFVTAHFHEYVTV